MATIITRHAGPQKPWSEARGPRVSGYDAQGREFHGHARLVDPISSGATGTPDLIFEVPDGVQPRRVLIASGMVNLAG